jgi:hypothetical protein
MNYIYRISSLFNAKVKAKYVWWERKKKLPLWYQPDLLEKDYIYDLNIQTWKYWWDILFTSWFETLIKKSLYDKMVENWFVNWYKTFKVINTVNWWPEYVGIVVIEDWWKVDEKYITYVEETWWKSPIDFKWYNWIEKWNDIFGLVNIPWKFISEKLHNFLQENADIWNVEFKQIECI